MDFRWIKAELYGICILWTVWLVLKNFKTPCFDLFDEYITLVINIGSMIANDLARI